MSRVNCSTRCDRIFRAQVQGETYDNQVNQDTGRTTREHAPKQKTT
ncbi:hypothetical protein L917_11451 [Phytophthora nicotianae]|uniref:Uncharacterized protein n=3 Tax=Phytophthora nicotianae TaxID=4792 RepID=W2Q2C1_PHYN3|nr:hypothetical protein PPTG_23343 [Phytophthora nicotianae INRA-310]ETI43017.1 hypothetical protein F443_11952 [Phytophthora nicotianae P1569]ETL36426.1 hypothetical protein L916_11584 [Phytophthora nicotianae]ETL89642.1 hypothetical protein L917_11451 [Phytophthora nicotianae]ETM42913.1 hypothetical protein L914_11500 [Phytophthora nicotianae]ETN06719.1 hypothetical protein PPTG_23343 [Phytophthora nicotianae INRA-310]